MMPISINAKIIKNHPTTSLSLLFYMKKLENLDS